MSDSPSPNVLLDSGNYRLEKKQLLGNGCLECNNKFFPKRSFCPSCLQKETMDEFVMPDKGTLYSYTTIHVGPKKFNPPYSVGYVDVNPEIRLFGHVKASSLPNIRMNQTMKISIEPIGQDKEQTLLGVVFTACEEAN